jgi:hypothetical protein
MLTDWPSSNTTLAPGNSGSHVPEAITRSWSEPVQGSRKMNALNAQVQEELGACARQVDADPGVRAVVIVSVATPR